MLPPGVSKLERGVSLTRLYPCKTQAFRVLSNRYFSSASLTRREHARHEPIAIVLLVWHYLTKFQFLQTNWKLSRHSFQCFHGGRWWRKQIAWLKLRDFVGYVKSIFCRLRLGESFFLYSVRFSCQALQQFKRAEWRTGTYWKPNVFGLGTTSLLPCLSAGKETGLH